MSRHGKIRALTRAFSLVELLVVIGIIALLIAMLMPALSRARAQANSIKCQANLHVLGSMLTIYENENAGYLYPVGPPEPGSNVPTTLGTNVPPNERWPMKVYKFATPNPMPFIPDNYPVGGGPADSSSPAAQLLMQQFPAGPFTPPSLLCPVDIQPYEAHSYVLNSHLADKTIKAGSHNFGGLTSSDVIVAGEKVTTQRDYYMEGSTIPGDTNTEFDRVVEKYRHGIRLGSNYLYVDSHVGTVMPNEALTGMDPWDLRQCRLKSQQSAQQLIEPQLIAFMTNTIQPDTVQTGRPASDAIRRLPLWLNILVLLLVLGGGAWFLWNQWIGGSPAADKPVDIGKVNYNRPMYRAAPSPAMDFNRQGVYPAGPPNTFRIRSGDFFMTLTPTESALFPLRLYYAKPDLVPQSVWEQLLMARDITSNPARAQSVGTTPEQNAKLRALFQNAGAGMIMSDADRDTLRTDWKAYNDAKDDAGRSSAQTSLLAAMKDIGSRTLDPTRAELQKRGDQVSQILTADQISKYHQSRGR